MANSELEGWAARLASCFLRCLPTTCAPAPSCWRHPSVVSFANLPATRDRAFTELGVKNYVNVDISIAEDTLGFDSKLPCNLTINEMFDECAYNKESIS